MTKTCPNCGKRVGATGSVLVAIDRCWSCSNWFFCECGMEGQLRVGNGRMQGKEKMVWVRPPPEE